MVLKDKSLESTINLICMRPEMFVGTRSIESVAAFIEGFAYGQCPEKIRNFNEWLSIKLGFPKNWAWWCGMESKFTSVDEFLDTLPKLFKEFLKETKEQK